MMTRLLYPSLMFLALHLALAALAIILAG